MIEEAKIQYETYRFLQHQETTIAIPSRIQHAREELENVEKREKALQALYKQNKHMV